MKLLAQIGRFGIVGIIATVVHVTLFLSLVEGFAIKAFWANLLAFSTAVFVSYFGNLIWTFAMPEAGLGRLPRFVLVAFIGLVANQTIVLLLVDLLGQSPRLAIAIVVIVVPAITYLACRWWIFTPLEEVPSPD